MINPLIHSNRLCSFLLLKMYEKFQMSFEFTRKYIEGFALTTVAVLTNH